jgi:hypothetical protein
MEKLWGEWLISQGLSGHLFWHTMRLYLWNENREREREREGETEREERGMERLMESWKHCSFKQSYSLYINYA